MALNYSYINSFTDRLYAGELMGLSMGYYTQYSDNIKEPHKPDDFDVVLNYKKGERDESRR